LASNQSTRLRCDFDASRGGWNDAKLDALHERPYARGDRHDRNNGLADVRADNATGRVDVGAAGVTRRPEAERLRNALAGRAERFGLQLDGVTGLHDRIGRRHDDPRYRRRGERRLRWLALRLL
jgi:hypothetical protein